MDYSQVASLYSSITGGAYTPTQADLSQFGDPSGFDSNYWSKISSAISQWWQQYQTQHPTNPTTPTDGGGSQQPTYSDPNSMMQALLANGTDPQSAIQQVNAQFNLPSGSSYAWRSIPGAPGGGVVEVPGGSYYAPGPDGAWGWNAGDSGGGGGAASGGGGGGFNPQPAYQPPSAPQYTPYTVTPYKAPAPYTLPTEADVQNTPGYQFTLDQGLQAANRSSIASGGYGGGTLKELEQYGTGLADQYYQNAVANSLNAYNTNAQTGLASWSANTNAGLSAAGLNLQGVNQQFQNTYLPSLQSYQMALGQNEFGANYGLAAQNQYWNQGFQENQNAFNQYNTSQNAAFQQWLALAELGNPGNPYA